MNPRIQKLAPVIVHKIAAGEVIESPASVIKELVENSIDADADEIHISTASAGLKQILVSDNGCGIHPEDIPLAIQEHATSKIYDVKDLENIFSYGFRGEALASISSISELIVSSRIKELKTGKVFKFSESKLTSQKEMAMNCGTGIEVINLFYNTPVRRKFLKSERGENENIKNVIINLALSNPQIKFHYIRDKKQIFQLESCKNKQERIIEIYGRDFFENFIPVSLEYGNYAVQGFISHPHFYRSSRKEQHFFINNRPVKIKGASQLFRKAYGDLLPSRAFPLGFLFFKINPQEIDVNVHPAKKELRFLDEYRFNGFILTALKKTLQENTSLNIIELKKRISGVQKKPNFSTQSAGSVSEESQKNQENISFSKIPEQTPEGIGDKDYRYSSFIQQMNELHETGNDAIAESGEKIKDLEKNGKDVSSDKTQNRLRIIRHFGLIFDTFILAEGISCMYIIDQHTAHERILYEEILGKFDSDQIPVQNLLTPIIENVNQNERELVEDYKEVFQKCGVHVDFIGKTQVVINSVPSYIKNGRETALFRDILSRIESADNTHSSGKTPEKSIQTIPEISADLFDEMAKSIACHSAIKSGDKVSGQIISDLINDLNRCNDPMHCPHGRPTIIRLTHQDLEKLFHRI
jgi:DNA mismatch repair protein MutL